MATRNNRVKLKLTRLAVEIILRDRGLTCGRMAVLRQLISS
jgi:hypothetical protein